MKTELTVADCVCVCVGQIYSFSWLSRPGTMVFSRLQREGDGDKAQSGKLK